MSGNILAIAHRVDVRKSWMPTKFVKNPKVYVRKMQDASIIRPALNICQIYTLYTFVYMTNRLLDPLHQLLGSPSWQSEFEAAFEQDLPARLFLSVPHARQLVHRSRWQLWNQGLS